MLYHRHHTLDFRMCAVQRAPSYQTVHATQGTSIQTFATKTKLNSVAVVREQTIPTERPPPVGEGSANFCG